MSPGEGSLKMIVDCFGDQTRSAIYLLNLTSIFLDTWVFIISYLLINLIVSKWFEIRPLMNRSKCCFGLLYRISY